DVIDLEGTYYRLDYSGRELDIQRKSEVTVASGTKMKKDDPDYDDFLKQTVTMTATGEETLVPELEIVDEDTAASDMNLVLIGGPVANSLVADLVTAGKSKVDWYTSEGDIEVISDHPASGLTSIIVAGKDREATRAAAEALAAAL
ncbi:S-layer protein, partial [Candidatus Pyrohabitans sp.]